MKSSPLYLRIQDKLRADIAGGKFTDGKPLPSESDLARAFRTTRSTVRQALAQLTFEGLIVRQMGRGTFVNTRPLEGRLEIEPERRPQSFEEQAEAAGAGVTFRLIGFVAEPASAAVADSLGVEPAEIVYRLRRLRLADATVVGYEDRRLVGRVGAVVSIEDLMTQSTVAIAEKALGSRLGGMTVRVSAESAAADMARLLGMARGKPVLRRDHAFFDRDGLPVVVGDAVYRADKFSFTYHFGRTQPA